MRFSPYTAYHILFKMQVPSGEKRRPKQEEKGTEKGQL